MRLHELQKIVKETVGENKTLDALRAEATRVLGPAVIVEGCFEQVLESINDRIEVLDRTGRGSSLAFKPSVVVKLLNNHNVEARKLAGRLLPEKFILRLVNDREPSVRHVVAKRLPLKIVEQMVRRNRYDDQLLDIYNNRLVEEGLPNAKPAPKEFDMYGKKLGDVVKQHTGPELSDQWYADRAFKLHQDYNHNIEGNWEEKAVHRYCASCKATNGLEIDEERLLQAVKDLIEDREDRAMERNALKETLDWLRASDDSDVISESIDREDDDDHIDEVKELVRSNLSSGAFIEKANKLFKIRESILPPTVKKHRLGESRSETIPVVGYLPHQMGFRALDEQALDLYVKHWNSRQSFNGEPLKLGWSHHPDAIGKIGFRVILR